jgi:V/A-type H+-transporting ATPase subunit E
VDSPETKSHAVLRDEILADAKRQAQRLIRKAEREAKAAVDKATAESQEERTGKLASAQTNADRKRTLITATVPVEIGRMRAGRVEQELTALCEQVRVRLQQRRLDGYEDILVTLAAEALASMEGDSFLLELSHKDRETLGDKLAAAAAARAGRPDITVTVSTEPARIDSGVIVRDVEGRQVWDNSLEARLDRMWPLLRSQIADHMAIQSNAAPSGGQS